ncbi:pentatricopeptide repeat-containing protein At2g37230 [Lactuca sativa]|uniref:pentatricopeptide repeat-containing protein At2g37230 n=1 Tax=Lactuca sativa TaxID=4236 RepID=UPI000CACFF5B|nr:pentatricopeptide repeat-containing protein At2g37230 [Lactuca sativa]
MASLCIPLSKPQLLKYYFHRISKPLHRFYSSAVDKPPYEETPNPKTYIATSGSQVGAIENGKLRIPGEHSPNPDKVRDAICIMMEDDEWSTRLQTSIRNLVPLLDHNLVSSVLNRYPSRALEFFQWVEGSGFKHDRETHYKMIEILCTDRRLEDAKRILLGMSKKGIDYDEDPFVLLIHGYSKVNRKWDIVKNCVKIFSKMEDLGVPRTIKSYNSMLEVIISEKKYTMAEKFFDKMLSEGVVPSKHTYTLMISGFCRSSRMETANCFFEDMKSQNYLPDIAVYNTMINGYVQAKKMEEVEKLLMEMKERKMEPSLVTYNSVINGYAKVGKMEDSEKLLKEMKARNVEPSLITYNTMINGYTVVGKMEDIQKLVVEMTGRNIEPDLVTYVTMIKGYVTVNRIDDGLNLVKEMKRKRFGKNVDVYSCLSRLKDDFEAEKMSETQRNVLQEVEDHVQNLELLALRDDARELSQLANQIANHRSMRY